MNWPLRILIFAAAAFCVSSCGTNPIAVVSNENVQTANSESVMAVLTDELDDLGSVVLNNFNDSGLPSGGRAEVFKDNRLTCPGTNIVFSNVSADHTSGQLTITFPEGGCVDGLKQNKRKGSIVITWFGGKWYQAGSTHVISFNNYSMNDIVFSGTRTLKCTTFTFATPKIFNVTWDISGDHTLTWPDGTSASFKVNKTRVWVHSVDNERFRHTTGPNGDYILSGINRHGKEFTVTLATTLIYFRSCSDASKSFVPANGIKHLTDIKKNKVLTIDYGASDCDDLYTLTVDGVKTVLHAKNDSSDD